MVPRPPSSCFLRASYRQQALRITGSPRSIAISPRSLSSLRLAPEASTARPGRNRHHAHNFAADLQSRLEIASQVPQSSAPPPRSRASMTGECSSTISASPAWITGRLMHPFLASSLEPHHGIPARACDEHQPSGARRSGNIPQKQPAASGGRIVDFTDHDRRELDAAGCMAGAAVCHGPHGRCARDRSVPTSPYIAAIAPKFHLDSRPCIPQQVLRH